MMKSERRHTMQVKEIEQLLNISKDNLRYYESEGLIFPARKANGYRDYSDEDVKRLKKVLVLRKLNVPVADIREILNGAKDLNDALDETRRRIDQKIASMNEAKTICEEIEKEHISINELDADRYLERIASEKPSGFNDLKKDVLNYTSELFVESFGHFQWFFPIFKPLLWKRKRKGSVVLAVIVLILLIFSAGNVCWRESIRNNGTEGHFFFRGMLTMCGIILIWIMLRNITYFLSKRYSKAEKPIVIIGSILSALVSVLLYYGAILHWNRILMFRPYNDPPVIRCDEIYSIKISADDEIPRVTNEWKSSHRFDYYLSYDREYNDALKEAILSCEPSGVWSVTKNEFTMTDSQDETGFPEKFYEIALSDDDPTSSSTVFFVLKANNGIWMLDEPNYGIHRASDQLMELIGEYEKHISLNDGTIYTFRRIFEYDPEKVWPGSYEDGRFDTYEYLTITDKKTGEDITETFIAQYKDAYENKDWETIIDAWENVQTSWRTEYVNPEAAHMETYP